MHVNSSFEAQPRFGMICRPSGISRIYTYVCDIESVLHYAQNVITANKNLVFNPCPKQLREGQFLEDFVQVIEGSSKNGTYDGICW
jgi:hypothetical protein